MKKMKLIYIGLGLTSILTYAIASVPHTFRADTAAKASEVNDNFNSLDNRITSLENKSGSDSGDGREFPDYDGCDKSVFSYQYKYIPSNIGDEITIGENKYRIVAVPFEEFGSKEHYYIKFPERIYDKWRRTDLTMSYVKSGSSCYHSKIKNFPASFNSQSYNRTIRIGSDYNSDTKEYEDSMKIYDSSYVSASVKINQTVIRLPYFSSSKTLQNNVISKEKFDFRNDIDWQKLNIQNQLVENVKKFFNYIDIVKIEN